MTDQAPERIWIQSDTPGHFAELHALSEPPMPNVSYAFTKYLRADKVQALVDEAREEAVKAYVERLCDNLHLADSEAMAIANRISGRRGEPNRCPDGVQVLEDAETILRATAAAIRGEA
mgnify:CR=1 FL=1